MFGELIHLKRALLAIKGKKSSNFTEQDERFGLAA